MLPVSRREKEGMQVFLFSVSLHEAMIILHSFSPLVVVKTKMRTVSLGGDTEMFNAAEGGGWSWYISTDAVLLC